MRSTTQGRSDAEAPLTIGELGEHALIERLVSAAPPAPPSVPVGIGDDAAVVEPERGTLTVITTDALVDEVHFDRTFTTAEDIGHKALAVNLSDLAAMGATPRHALLSLALPETFRVSDFDALVRGVLTLADRHRVTLIGGNITRSSGPLFVDVTATGSVKRRRVLTRDRARAGDELYVSGQLGGAAVGLAWLQQATAEQRATDEQAACRQRYLRPEPRIRLGRLLGRNRATRACVDLSDGLADAIRQLASASRVGAVVEADALPIQADARAWFEGQGIDPVVASLAAGEDYELMFTVPSSARRRLRAVSKLVKDLRLTRIGRMTKASALVLERNGKAEPLPAGFEHFT